MKRRDLVAAGPLALLLTAPLIVRGAGIVGVRVWPASEYTRVTIESDTALVAQHTLLADPPRLVIDIEGLTLDAGLRELVGKVQADDPFIAGVRVGQFKPDVVRLVVDLKQATLPQQFTAAPVAAYKHRLMFDLYPTQPLDPLLALLDQHGQHGQHGDSEAASRSVQQALDELIARVDAASAPPTPSAASAPTPGKTRPARPAPVQRLIVVAIDPGHGGEDPGATGPTGLNEKDVVLDIARRLRQRLNAEPGMRAMLTRDADYFVPLYTRVGKARRVQADLFVSIHADAFIRPEARGASVFALSTRGASSAAARWMAQRENAADRIGGVNVDVADRQVMRAMLDMSTHAQIQDSLVLGREVLRRIGHVGRLHKDHVEQAGFAVLKAPDIPSILVETAFISNPEEEALLRDDAYRDRLVLALAAGIKRYFAQNPPLARNRTS